VHTYDPPLPMIKFFKKIRQKLVSENKFSKYLLYAIGEIILVVIGIVLALQLNNWNEQRKLKVQEVELLNYTLENIKRDSIIISDVLNELGNIINTHEDLIAVINNDKKPEDVKDIDLIRRSFPNKAVTKKNNPDLTKQILDMNLKKELLEYFLVMDKTEFVTDSHNNLIEEKLRAFLGEKELLNYGNQFTGFTNEMNLINTERFFQELNKPKLQQVLFEAGVKLNAMKINYEEFKAQNSKLKKVMKNYLK
jgi:hypothetical protein